MSQDKQPTFWSLISLKSKIGIWSQHQIDRFRDVLFLRSNEFIIDIGAGFSPLGQAFFTYILPKGRLLGIDKDINIVDSANQYAKEQGKENYMSFQQGDIMHLSDNFQADLLMCQQLLVNLVDPITALEEMIKLTKTTGRLFCIENMNYGAFCSRPDFSFRTNLKVSQIWQQLCVMGKWGADYASTGFGTNLPLVFQELGLKNIQWQIISPDTLPYPPYSEEFVQNFKQNFKAERNRLAIFYRKEWAPHTDLTKEEIEFFIENMVLADYDLKAIEENKPLTLWFFPFMAIVGWINEPSFISKNYEDKVDINLDF